MDFPSWSLGLSLIVLTIAMHTTAVVFMALGLETRFRVQIDTHARDRLHAIPAVIVRIGAVALLLAALHGVEGVTWAVAYRWLGAFDSFTDASVYSLATMTTSETRGITLPARWQMLSALEAVNGGLLFGISTAFLFAVIQVHWQMLLHRSDRSADH
ncbi:hypothetical protein Mycch_2236 [Mycolicibacterium chubuense NBB4]|uniref:Ion channel n=1 Tax=Mycolicibacterium chubuense (strain NBB4) TaxID=710421 RepID=I4BIA6_MYCCN|nr:hypothetical protein [Mycolicibacterium chubuense]AFM17013.1 hypothetical protein Mycch_2236 [Mycolicibacterium chubuense NBB4]